MLVKRCATVKFVGGDDRASAQPITQNRQGVAEYNCVPLWLLSTDSVQKTRPWPPMAKKYVIELEIFTLSSGFRARISRSSVQKIRFQRPICRSLVELTFSTESTQSSLPTAISMITGCLAIANVASDGCVRTRHTGRSALLAPYGYRLHWKRARSLDVCP
jgi:hypothetical protein